MSDLLLMGDRAEGDFVIDSNDLSVDDSLKTAIRLSLFCDRRAAEGDVLPYAQADRRGWWGDATLPNAGDQFGSRLWLLSRDKQLPTTLERARGYALEALAWLITDRVASAIDVQASFPDRQTMQLVITVQRPTQDPASFEFSFAWDALGRVN